MNIQKLAILIIALTLGCLNTIQAMDNTAIQAQEMKNFLETNNWRSIREVLWKADEQQKPIYLQMLLNTKTNLNIFGQNSQSLLKDLVVWACPGSDQLPEIKQKCKYLTKVLKELIKHNKLDPNLTCNGKSVIHALNEENATQSYYTPEMFSRFLGQVCDQACDEARILPRSFTTKFHTYESFISEHGFRKYRLKWRPLCLLVDYRTWATSVAFVAASSWFFISHKKKRSAQIDEEQEETNDTPQSTTSLN